MRRLLAFVLVLGLAPGVTTLLLEGGAHCAHACCQGQDFCHRGSRHDHEAAAHDGSHHALPVLAVSAIEPPARSCSETCGVLPNARPKADGPVRAQQIDFVQRSHSRLASVVVADGTAEPRGPASPRAPPRKTRFVNL